MSINLSKLCTDNLQASYSSQTSNKLQPFHSEELVAAFFGYESHAALVDEKNHPLNKLEEAHIFIPDIPLMDQCRVRLKDLQQNLPSSKVLAEHLSDFLSKEGYFSGEIWLYDTLESYIAEVFLPKHQSIIDEQLSGVMAETNASFSDQPYYEDLNTQDNDDELIITAKAKYQGEHLDDKSFCGDTIDTTVQVELLRIAGKRGFLGFEIESGGVVNDDWVDPELKS